MGLEKDFKQKVTRFLKTLPNTFFFVKEARAIRGIPDIIACIHGHFVGLELKKDRKSAFSTSPRLKLQIHTLQEIRRSGGYGELIFPEIWLETKQVLTDLAEGKHYDHIDIRKRTRSLFRERLDQVGKPRRVRSIRRLINWADGESNREFSRQAGGETSDSSERVRGKGRKGEPEAEQ